jgi:hypothetical protein
VNFVVQVAACLFIESERHWNYERMNSGFAPQNQLRKNVPEKMTR